MNEKCSVSDQDNRLHFFHRGKMKKRFIYVALSPPGRGGGGVLGGEGLRVLDLTKEHKLNWA